MRRVAAEGTIAERVDVLVEAVRLSAGTAHLM